MSDKATGNRVKRPRHVVVMRLQGEASGDVTWAEVDSGPNFKNATEAQRMVDKGYYGEGTYWVLSTLEARTTVTRVEKPTYVYKATKEDRHDSKSADA